MAETAAVALATTVGTAVAKAVADKVTGYFAGDSKTPKNKKQRTNGGQRQSLVQRTRFPRQPRNPQPIRGNPNKSNKKQQRRDRTPMDQVNNAPIRQNVISKAYHKQGKPSKHFKGMYNGGVSFEGEFNVMEIRTYDAVSLGSDLGTAFFNPKFFKNTRLAYDSNVWQRFWFEEVTLIYNPVVASTTAGSLAFGILDNVAIQPPQAGILGLQNLSNLRGSFQTSVSSQAFSVHKFLKPSSPLLCSADIQADVVGTLSNQARLIIKAGSTLAVNTTYGMLKMRYKVHFYEELYPVTSQIYQQTNNFYLGTYANIDKSAVKQFYILSRASPEEFPRSIDSQWYNVILNQAVTLDIYNWELTEHTVKTYQSGHTWIGFMRPNDTNMTALYDSPADAAAGIQSSLFSNATITNMSVNFTIISREALETVTSVKGDIVTLPQKPVSLVLQDETDAPEECPECRKEDLELKTQFDEFLIQNKHHLKTWYDQHFVQGPNLEAPKRHSASANPF